MSSPSVRCLLRFLSCGEFRSNDAISAELGCHHADVDRHIRTLRGLGLEIDTLVDQGYRLREPLELLHKASILASVDSEAGRQIDSLSIEFSVDSSNSALKRLPLNLQHGAVILAEHQSGGRGRRGRNWYSPLGRNLYLSLGWVFEKSFADLACLSLVVALATAKALSRSGLQGHCVKWPNDVMLHGRKLCGCLVEVQGDTHGPCNVVVGVGINVHMPAVGVDARIDQPWTDMVSQLPECSRNELASLLLEELLIQLGLFSRQGFDPFRDRWRQLDGLRGETVDVWLGDRSVHGIALGIDADGALRLDTGKQVLSLHSGEASLRDPGGLKAPGK